jgi:hypothetical protein
MRRMLPCLLVLVVGLCHAQVTSVFGRTGAIAANPTDYKAAQVTNAVDTTQPYSNPSWLLTLDWSKMINAPLNASADSVSVGKFASLGGNSAAVGHAALNSGGRLNTAVGDSALAAAFGTSANSAVGVDALLQMGNGGASTAVGAVSQSNNGAGAHDTSAGVASMFGFGGRYNGFNNTAVGDYSFYFVTTGSFNALLGMNSGYQMTTGSHNVAVGYQAGYTNIPANANTTGSNNTWIGDNAGPGTPTQLTNSTAIGANALVSQSNALVLGGTGVNAVNVGIGTTTPSNVFTIGQNAGHAIADGWDTYSSRRYKTNIQTLQGALAKVERLRGVSYNLKGSGKHEIGVIAEEVGEVVPEVVSWSKDGRQAEGVDYGRLTALLIEAMKEQQLMIHQDQEQIRAHLEQISQLASQATGIRTALNKRIHYEDGWTPVK